MDKILKNLRNCKRSALRSNVWGQCVTFKKKKRRKKKGKKKKEKKKRKKALPPFAEITTASEENHRATLLVFGNKATQYTELKTDTTI